jgi:MoxR-like ATPase
MRFEGASAYVATDDMKVAGNAAITLERPLLVKGQPGTGKTVLALEIAKSVTEAFDLGAARLAQAAPGRRDRARDPGQRDPNKLISRRRCRRPSRSTG